MSIQWTFSKTTGLELSDNGKTLGRILPWVSHQGVVLPFTALEQTFNTSTNTAIFHLCLDQRIDLQIEIQISRSSSDWVSLHCSMTNLSANGIDLDGFMLAQLILDPVNFSPKSHLWSMQGAAVGWGQDFAFELPAIYHRDNYLGHLQHAEGGGIPVNYFWTRSLGVAYMHVEAAPQEWYLPVDADGMTARTGLEKRGRLHLSPGEQVTCPHTVISAHHGDFYAPLALYRERLAAAQVLPAAPTPACFEPAWCSWGYEFDVTPQQMLGVLPALADLNIHWLTLDDRWFDAYGDWKPRSDTFPGGAQDMRRMNERIHAAGGKNQIWWYPLCAEDGQGSWESHTYGVSEVIRQHPDWVVQLEDGSVARNNRHLAMLCPALPEVQEYLRDLTRLFIQDWGFDGHKLDNIYTMPACHNPNHHHSRPEESVEAFAEAYRIIYETTLHLKPDAVIQICPCGTPLTHSLAPYTNQTVTADPTSSQQIRQRIKFYKALMGAKAAVFADHVELSDGGVDFASEIGCGGVPATKFIYPEDEQLKASLKEYWSLPAEKQALWKRWFNLYQQHRPAEGEFLNLYDLAYDFPEAYVIRKDGGFYYAFFAAEFSGVLELRGLEARPYRVVNYVTGQLLGEVNGQNPRVEVSFKGSLLLLATAL